MFSEILKQLRAKKGVTQIELARAIGISNGNVGDWERGRSKPGYDALISLSRYFEVSPEHLLELEGCGNTRIDLAEFKTQQGLVCDGSPLTEAETDLIAMFRLLSREHKEDIFDLTYNKYKRHVEKKEVSIFSTYSSTNTENDKSSGHTQEKIQDATA